ncbi:hypothetical protein MRX96_008620 [Rhipicephalus microplus]
MYVPVSDVLLNFHYAGPSAARIFGHPMPRTTSHQVGYLRPVFAGYKPTAVLVPYGRYDTYEPRLQPYSFSYDNVDEFGNRLFRSEQGDSNNVKTGSYGYRDMNGLYRRVNYVADAWGFRATVNTNQPGTTPGACADAVFNAATVVAPVPSGMALGGASSLLAAKVVAPTMQRSTVTTEPGYARGTYGVSAAYGSQASDYHRYRRR